MSKSVQQIFCFISVVALAVTTEPIAATAQDLTHECKAVFSKATITLSSKLILGISEDPNQKTCDFIISMPPSQAATTAANLWYKVKADEATNPAFAPKLLSQLLVELTPERARIHLKEIDDTVFKNAKLTSECFAALFKKMTIELKSSDGRFQCSTTPKTDTATFRLNAGNSFALTVMVPRPV